MKQIMNAAIAACILLGCNTATETKTSTDTTAASPASTEKVEYAYTIDKPDNWVPGDNKNTATALKTLKAFENGDIAECVKGFGDSVKVEFDGFEKKFSNDSLKSFFTAERNKFAKVTIKMSDWESVISKDKEREYVSLWYKQIWTDKKGKTDSLEVMDDLMIKDGKIVTLNEKQRRYDPKNK